jgi:hypothetical protein
MSGRRDIRAEQANDSSADRPVRCSFCHKPPEVVRKLISSPPEYPGSYICNECISVCESILEDDSAGLPAQHLETKPHPLLSDPIASDLLTAVEIWIKRESLGFHANAEFAAVRRIALRIMRTDISVITPDR